MHPLITSPLDLAVWLGSLLLCVLFGVALLVVLAIILAAFVGLIFGFFKWVFTRKTPANPPQ
jgi:uncharacterized membrane protein